jgi:Ni,Fe-hydrogenase III large subunit
MRMAAESAAEARAAARALVAASTVCSSASALRIILATLGFLGNDAGLAFGLAQLSRLKERVLRTNLALFQHRYLMDAIVPGGVSLVIFFVKELMKRSAGDREPASRKLLASRRSSMCITGLQDRLISTGRVAPELAVRLGIGWSGWTLQSAMAWDLRAQLPTPPYNQLDVRMVTHRNGDVAARVTVCRFEEVLESLKLCAAILDRMPHGEIGSTLSIPTEGSTGLGWVGRLARRSVDRAGGRCRGQLAPCSRSRPVVAELAGCSNMLSSETSCGFSADQ